MATPALLHQLLDDGVRFAPHYPPVWNSDHLPMTLSAMFGLGATEEQLKSFRQDYMSRLIPQAETKVPVTHWRTGLGSRRAYPALLDWFAQALREQPTEELVEAVLRETLPAISMDAFHPVIRLGFARQVESPSETAASLAYLVSTQREFPIGFEQIDLAGAVERQAAEGDLGVNTGRFSPSILSLLESRQYPVGTAGSLREVADVALSLYQSTRNFFALHLVTATQALRMAIPKSLEKEAISSMTGALLASHLVLGSPALTSEPLPAPSQLDPEHSFKYVWACWSEYEAYGNESYLDEIERFRMANLVPEWTAESLLGKTDRYR